MSRMNLSSRLFIPAALALAVGAVAAEQIYVSADERERPAAQKTEILPERFLRGYDPITIYFPDNIGPGKAPADDVSSLAKLKPSWPGAWTWLDKKTLQFRPAEAWPPLQRFSVESNGASRVLSTMMTAPTSMTPADGADGLRPFRTLRLTFPQELPLDALKQMLRIEERDLPGLGDSARVIVEKPAIAELPRADHKDPAVYAITLDEDVPEGKQLVVTLALALGDEGKALWTGRVSTRTSFQLLEVACAQDHLSVVGAPKAPRESALDCGSQGELPQLVFSAQPAALTLTAVKKLVRLEPSVADLRASVFGSRVQLEGKLVPDTLYKMKIASAPVEDNEGRALQDPGDVELYFYVGWKRPFLRFREGQAMLEQKGPRMIPLVGYGEPRADVRIYRIDPVHAGLWPFPASPVVVNEDSAPPFPGEEPALPPLGAYVQPDELAQHVRLLGSPLVSRVMDLPLLDKSGTTSFGLDIGPALDGAVGNRRPGTYLVGLRRLQGAPERSYVRVQVTNMSVTTAEERGKSVFFVRTLDTAEPVSGAKITLDAENDRKPDGSSGGFSKVTLTTDAQGKAVLLAAPGWMRVIRVVVENGEDVLVLDPRDAPPRFFANHWSSGSMWLQHVTSDPPPPVNDRELGFLFVDRPIYRPGEKVFLKGFAREKKSGVLTLPTVRQPGAKADDAYLLEVNGPGDKKWTVTSTKSALFGFDGVFSDPDAPTGRYTATLVRQTPGAGTRVLASRSFQIEAYRLPTFELQLTGPLRARLDAPFKVKAVARYYAGGNVAHEKIKWTVTRRPAWHVPNGREGYLFASSSQFARPEARTGGEKTEKSSELNDDGSDEIEVNPALDLDGSPRTYRFEATVTGADNQEVTSVVEVEALPPFTLGMKMPRFQKSASVLEPEIIAVGVDDKLLAGQKVQVRLYKRTWHSHLREGQFATGQASYVTEMEDTKLLETEVVTAASAVKPQLPIKEAGVYVVEIAARDALGRLQTLNADLYIGGKEPMAWQKGQAGVFEIVPDKEDYVPGETANVVIKSPFVRGKALVIVEEPNANRYEWIDVSNGQGTVQVPVLREHTPNLPVHVVLMRGRLGESSTDDAPYRPQTMAGSVELRVRPSQNLVKLEVKHPESARPGTTVDVTLNLKDDKGAPIGGEVTLWLVDEAVLSLAPEGSLDPLTQMIVRNDAQTSVFDTRNRVVGRLLEEEAPGGDGAEEEPEGTAHRRVRKNFQTVPYYQATLVVPASGKLVVPLALSDDLTNFMVRAVAVSGAERFGKSESRLKVRQPVLVQPQLPRFVRMGDRFDGGGVARLVEGAEGPGYVKLEMDGPVDARKRSKDINLSLNKAQSVTFPVEVKSIPTEAPLKLRVDVVRKADNVGDAFEVTIPVMPDGPMQQDAWLETWQPGAHAMKAFPEAPRKGSVRQDVVVTSVPGLLELLAALQYVDEYPHGCLEQKMARLAPQLALLELSGQLGGFEYAPGLKGHVQRLVGEMPAHQDDEGLYGFWPGSTGNVQLTADALLFVAAAEKIGVKADERSKARAIEALQRSLRSDYKGFIEGWRYNQQSSALRALFGTGTYDDHYLVDLFRARREMDLMSRTELALAMSRRAGVFESDLKTTKDELWKAVSWKLEDGKRVFGGVVESRTWWGAPVLGSSTATTANLLEALMAIDPGNPDTKLVFEGLLKNASGYNAFGSTYDNRRAVNAIIAYLTKSTIGRKDTTVSLQNGARATLATMKVGDKPKIDREVVDSEDVLTAMTTGDAVQARVRRTWMPAMTGDKLGATKDGFVVQRAMTLITPDGAAPVRMDDAKAAERLMSVGDVVEMHATVTTNEDRRQVALVVPFAAGLEPLNPELKTSSSEAIPTESDSTRPTYVQRLDHEVRYYFEYLPRGTYSFHFRLKATTAGSFVQPPATAELMYRQSVRGRSDGVRVIVTPRGEL